MTTYDMRVPAAPAGWRDHRSGSPQVDLLLRALDLDPAGPDPSGTGWAFTGMCTPWPRGRVFGGQILAQSMIAAARTTGDDTAVHSLHAYFVRPGDPRSPIRYLVEPLRDGRSFHTRRIDAWQGGRLIFTALGSFHSAEPGLAHQDERPDRPGPEGLPVRFPFLPPGASPDEPGPGGPPPDAVEIRTCPAEEPGRAEAAVWMRITAPLPDDPLLHRALTIYLTDFTVLYGFYRRHDADKEAIRHASLDHALWLHRTGRADDWLLYESRSPSAGDGRATGTGRLFARDGDLLASTGQEMIMRLPPS